jgi:hypothetical protein
MQFSSKYSPKRHSDVRLMTFGEYLTQHSIWAIKQDPPIARTVIIKYDLINKVDQVYLLSFSNQKPCSQLFNHNGRQELS